MTQDRRNQQPKRNRPNLWFIEGTISFLKRVVGLERCTWRTLESFHSYVLSSVATANVLLLARHRLAT
jgi:transposase, IS5 family